MPLATLAIAMSPAALIVVYFVFFLSGVSALIFETVWFRQTGLAFGNSVWASALVLSSFMAGLALGNGLTARFGHRIRRPIAFYAGLELVIAISGVALVVALPVVTPLLANLMRPLMVSGTLLQLVRFGTAFLLLLTPAIAMGATLPTVVKAVVGPERDFGKLLGRLYGINTLGAVLGALTCEFVWIPVAGVIGSGCIAGSLNLIAALLALAVARRISPSPARELVDEGRGRLPLSSLPLLAAAFLSGGTLLALEVIWFRTLSHFMAPTSEVFASMLAVVLAGIGMGGLLASWWLRVKSDADDQVPLVALGSGAVTMYSYAILPASVERLAGLAPGTSWGNLALALPLMFPASVLSGVLFALLGQRLRRSLASNVRSAGLVLLFNTAGSMLGPLVAGFVLLPRIGVERSVWLLSVTYGVVAVCALALSALRSSRRGRLVHVAAAALFVWAIVAFPWGLMQRLIGTTVSGRFADEQVIAAREGVNETLLYLRTSFLGEPYSHRLVTNGHSMSGTALSSQRYMSLYVYTPFAFHAKPRDALLISFGVGTTAKTLTNDPELERIDIVDISRDILEMSAVIFPREENPLSDPRVHIHVEDGRYFLQSTTRRYDLITAEPPPPAHAGVVNLYTREYFELLRSRLREGGLASYWLPVFMTDVRDSKAIVRAFCGAFPDCSLWEGDPGNWTLLGTRDAQGPLDEATIRRQWSDPEVAHRLRAVGVERAEQLAALFLADAPFLSDWAGEVPPLVDNWPHRAPRVRPSWTREVPREYARIMSEAEVMRRFEESEFVAKMWPVSFRDESLEYFAHARIARTFLLHKDVAPRIAELHRVLTETSLETLPLWLLGSDFDKQAIAERLAEQGRLPAEVDYQRGLRALSRRDYPLAADLLSRRSGGDTTPLRDHYAVYALAMSGQLEEARARAAKLPASDDPLVRRYWRFMDVTFGVRPSVLSVLSE